MGVLQDFERRLEGAVEGFFARAFRSGLQPIELAKALQRYAEDTQHVTADGVVVPNVYRFLLNPKDGDRLATFGDQLNRELADVVTRTSAERSWSLRGPAAVRLQSDDEIAYGMFELSGRVEAVDRPSGGEDRAAGASAEVTVLTGDDAGQRVALSGSRLSIGRLSDCDVPVDEPTVSREHAALVRRGDRWWIVDLGSTNGTSVNGTSAAEQPLDDGDRIELGDAVIEYRSLADRGRG